MLILQDMRTWRFWRHFWMRSFAIFGGISTFLQTNNVINPSVTTFQGSSVLIMVAAMAIFGGVAWSWPRPITAEYNTPKTKITIARGNIFEEKGHLVIGTNDTFDTETPVIIAKTSLQGQALDTLFGGDLKELDAQLGAALSSKQAIGTAAKPGKQARYGVGTIATLKHGARLVFFLAYTELDLQNKAGSTPDKMWKSLLALWEEISKRGNGGIVSVPVFGGGLARLSSLLPAQDAIRFTVLSFMIASRGQKVCDELRIIVIPEDYKKLDRLELQSFLSSMQAS
jgi:Domain of unknown function (DUF6430)